MGLLLEAYGFWLLFCEFFPTVLQFFRKVPFMGRMLDLPVIKTVRPKHLLGGGTRMSGPQR